MSRPNKSVKAKTVKYVVLRDCFGFRGQYWKRGDPVTVEAGTKVPSHFHDVTKPLPAGARPIKASITAGKTKRKSLVQQGEDDAPPEKDPVAEAVAGAKTDGDAAGAGEEA